MSTSLKSTTLGFLLIILLLNKFNECKADNLDYDAIIDTTIRTGALNFFFLPPPYGAIFGSIAMIGAEAYIHIKHQTSASRYSLNSQPLIDTVKNLKELAILDSQNEKKTIEYALNNVLITKDLSETFAFLDDCYGGMCLNCFVKKNTCPSLSYNAVKRNLLDETSDYRTKLHGFIHNYIALNKIPIVNGEPLRRIFELMVHDYKNRVNEGRDCGQHQSEHTKIINAFFRILDVLEKSYSFVLLASIDEYNINIAMNDTKEAAHRLNNTIKIINNLYDDTTRLVREVKWAINETSADIRPCDPVEPKRGKTWERLTHFVQPELFGYEKGLIGKKFPICESFLTPRQRLKIIQKENPTAFNCNATLYENMNYKYTNPNDTERLIHHFGDFHNRSKYGPMESDKESEKNLKENYLCEPILCYVDRITSNRTVRRFDLNPIIAQRDHFVTGIRWTIINRTVTLEIQEGKYDGNKILPSTLMWSKNLTSLNNVATLTAKKKSFSLDDVNLPPTYYVTGVRFAENKYQQIVLHVYGKKKYEENYKIFFSGSEKDRIKLQLLNAKPSEHAPSDIAHKILSKPVNKYIVDFEPSSLDDDAGQTTIPYLDIQEVFTKPPAMIGGVGTYYKGIEGHGGYIGLKLISPDVSYKIPEPKDPLLYHGIQKKLDAIAETYIKNNNSQELLHSLSNAFVIN
ncbi:hypothetical protein HCN44_008374 [Aphidius gifuensis]|uniref:Uncharacterized protein n=1 Tax=Aphidius gifuensis TaxID=684658 RepID=A0A834XMI0_APHGI|nr:hypothetical protein HCN44_008374 [Aphidius gifuensis]